MIKRLLRPIIKRSVINYYHLWQARLACLIYGFPANKLKVIGITGTNGKTTVAHFAGELLQAAGYKVGWITTTDYKIGDVVTPNIYKMTTFSPFVLQKLIRQIADAGANYLIMEVTSHAIDQNRVWGIRFAVATFTNLTHDHLDYHGNLTNYRQTKEKLFARTNQIHIVNADDLSAPYFLQYRATQKLTFAITDSLRTKAAKEQILEPNITATRLRPSSEKIEFTLEHGQDSAQTTLPMVGRFNISNALAAAAIAISQNVPFELIAQTIPKLHPVVGRMEKVMAGQPFTVMVDFAHTPDSLQKIYESLRPATPGKLISVLGATGRRDRLKRPILGTLAGRYCDFVIVTNEDPYDEDPRLVIDEVAKGVPRGRPGSLGVNGENEWWWRVPDRRDAIDKALKMAQKGDTVIITGKGGENSMAIGNKLIPYNDVKVVQSILSKLGYNSSPQ